MSVFTENWKLLRKAKVSRVWPCNPQETIHRKQSSHSSLAIKKAMTEKRRTWWREEPLLTVKEWRHLALHIGRFESVFYWWDQYLKVRPHVGSMINPNSNPGRLSWSMWAPKDWTHRELYKLSCCRWHMTVDIRWSYLVSKGESPSVSRPTHWSIRLQVTAFGQHQESSPL